MALRLTIICAEGFALWCFYFCQFCLLHLISMLFMVLAECVLYYVCKSMYYLMVAVVFQHHPYILYLKVNKHVIRMQNIASFCYVCLCIYTEEVESLGKYIQEMRDHNVWHSFRLDMYVK